jgi:hypothetical protein
VSTIDTAIREITAYASVYTDLATARRAADERNLSAHRRAPMTGGVPVLVSVWEVFIPLPDSDDGETSVLVVCARPTVKAIRSMLGFEVARPGEDDRSQWGEP